MKKLMLGIFAAMAMGVMAETVTVTKFHQSYPYSGKATVEYTVGGTLPANAFAEITLNTDDASAIFVHSNIVTGANTFTFDFASSFGGALLLTNASFVVTIAEAESDLDGVQLWENGPYWAECNVGATSPEEYGYYFWWGDTVGYTASGGTWTDYGWGDGYDGVTWVSSTGEQMSSSPFSSSTCPTYGKDNSPLLSAGYIDSTDNLVAAHDAATAHLGSPWRMPTYAEFSALINNCTTEWITTNGVYGQLVTGKGDYANRSIFLPAAGYGCDYSYVPGSDGDYWSSTPDSAYSDIAWALSFWSSYFSQSAPARYSGRSVRPVRGLAGAVAFGIVTYAMETQMTPVPVPYAWLDAYVPGVAHESEAYEAAAQATAANGRKVWECYVMGLDPQVATSDFRIASFPMKADGTPDWTNVTFDPPQEQWNVPDAPVVWKGAAQLEGPWRTVLAEDGSPHHQFFKAVVFGNTDDIMVQLWKGGPYWATTNVGAEKPWEYGYYFWWGDTVGYTNTGSGWISVKDGTSISFTSSGTAASTYGKSNSQLQSAGYIDSTGNLVAAHDAATVHLGSPWRMPTDAEFSALVNNCTTTWITTNGVYGRLVTGKGDYASRGIFLPAAGSSDPGSYGDYWSSTPESGHSIYAPSFLFNSSSFYLNGNSGRYFGLSVRPVRDDTYAVTYKPGASGAGTQQTDTKAHGVALALEGAIFTRSGYTQTGWSTSDGGSKAYDLGAFYTLNATITLYPYWTANTYTVTYKPGANGSGTQQTDTKTHGVALTLKGATFTQSGYTQTGWSTSDGGSKAYDLGAFYTWNAAITLYPYWTANTYTVTYKPGANGSGTQQTDTKTHGVALTLKGATFTRSGYTQTGWSTSDGGSKAYNLNASYTSNAAITLYPYWTATSGSDTHDGVQLWEGGPYWATTNVGADEPWEYGYYFWWGDTVGYAPSGGTWTDYGWGDGRGYYSGVTWVSSTGEQMSSSPFDDPCPTINKDNSALLSTGYIDSTDNLVVAHDAATVHLGSPWRMPTDAEFSALIENCTTTWITTNGVYGQLVTGKGDYANRSIFLPSAGSGVGSNLCDPGSLGNYWSSTPRSYSSSYAWYLYSHSSGFGRSYYGYRSDGQPVRPVRGFAP